MLTLNCIVLKTKRLITALLVVAMAMTVNLSRVSAADNNYGKFSFGLHGAAFISYTDVKESSFLNSASDALTFGGGLRLNHHLSPAVTLQYRFMYAAIEGVNETRKLKFESDIFEASFNVRVSLNTLLTPQSQSNRWMNLYAFGGSGLLMHRSTLFDTETGDVKRYAYQGKDGVSQDDMHAAFMIPAGLGINFRVSDRVDIGLETSFNFVMTDELDALVVAGSRKDLYNYTGIGLTFRLGRNTDSKDWATPRTAMYPGDAGRLNNIDELLSLKETKIESVKETTSQDVSQVRSELSGVSGGQAESERRISQLDGTVEGLTKQLVYLETQLKQLREEQKTERFFSVQVMAQKAEISIEEAIKLLKIPFELEMSFHDGWYKYYTGRFNDLEDAKIHMQRIWGHGVKDAFIVKYDEGKLTPR